MRAVALGLIACVLAAGSSHAADPVCTTQTAVNGPTGKYISSYPNLDNADSCAEQCKATPDCAVFKYCNSQDACKNYWSRGGPDDEFKSCTLFTGPFTSSPPNDWTVSGITVGTCTRGSGGGTTVPGSLPADALMKNLKGTVFQSSTTASANECLAQCQARAECNGYNFCYAQACGSAIKGQCDLKQFQGPADYWGDQTETPGDGWISGGIKVSNTAPNSEAANYGGDVIVLDYNSLYYRGGPNHPGKGAFSPEECAAACKADSKCNTWVFCTSSSDCGPGCSQLEHGFDSKYEGDTTRFGMFGGCYCPGDNTPGRTDCLWPAYMCSLKYNAGKPPVYGTGNGFVSGTIQRRR